MLLSPSLSERRRYFVARRTSVTLSRCVFYCLLKLIAATRRFTCDSTGFLLPSDSAIF